MVQVDHPEEIPLVTAVARNSRPELVVTGVVTSDISRNVPVVSLASGRVMEIQARLGDTVQKGQLLLSVRSSDVSGAYSDYHKAVADEELARTQFERAKDLNAHGAISLNDLQVARDAEERANVDVETAAEHLRLLGNDPDKPNSVVEIHAPISGVITDQEVTDGASLQVYGPNPFTISDLSKVWVVCDVHEDQLASVRVGDAAEIRLNAYPDRPQRRDRQYWGHPRSESSDSQGSHRGKKSGDYACGYVRDGDVPRAKTGHEHGYSSHCDPASS